MTTARNELNTLEASGLVQVATLEPELEYLFRHALVQDAAYSSLLKQDRRTLHRLAADTLLALYPERRRELAENRCAQVRDCRIDTVDEQFALLSLRRHTRDRATPYERSLAIV